MTAGTSRRSAARARLTATGAPAVAGTLLVAGCCAGPTTDVRLP